MPPHNTYLQNSKRKNRQKQTIRQNHAGNFNQIKNKHSHITYLVKKA